MSDAHSNEGSHDSAGAGTAAAEGAGSSRETVPCRLTPPDRLRDLTTRHLDLTPDRLTADTRLGEDLYLDSLAAMELLTVVEDEFGIRLPEDLFAGIATYGEFAAAVTARATAQQARRL